MRNIKIARVLLFVFLITGSCKVDHKSFVKDEFLRDFRILVRVVEEQNLKGKEAFFQRILAIEEEEKGYDLYRKELDIRNVEMRKAADLGDLKLASSIQERYSYLTVLARDTKGKLVDLDTISDKNKYLVQYSIQKYDSIHIEFMKSIKQQ